MKAYRAREFNWRQSVKNNGPDAALLNKCQTHFMKLQWLIPLLSLLMISCGDNKEKAQRSNPHTAHMSSGENSSYCDSVNNGLIQQDTMKSSPHRTAMATINGTHVHLEYGSPGVKDRVIWGGLVAYDKVWVTGAHEATTVQFSKPVVIGGKTIPRGIYALFTIPGKEKWTVIINSRYEQHLADEYDEKEDLVKVIVEPQQSALTQRLTYTVSAAGEGTGEIVMQWEKLRITLPFKTTGS